MKSIRLLIIGTIILVGCNSGPSKKQYNKLSNELEECKERVTELKNTPQRRLNRGQKYFGNENFSKAKEELQNLINKYPNSDQSEKAKEIINKMKKIKEKKKQERIRRKKLGYKVLNEDLNVEVGDVQLSFRYLKIKDRFVFDRYGDRYHYRDAERGNSHLVATIRISAESKNPKLPPVQAYKMAEGELKYLGNFEYRFYNWEDYGSYLGNTADYSNDFKHTSAITFSAGLEIPESSYDNESLFVFVKKENCFAREENNLGNPPVSYQESYCGEDRTLSIEEAEDDYHLIKIFNEDML